MWKTTNSIVVRRVLKTNLPLCVIQNESMMLVDTGSKKLQVSFLNKLDKLSRNKQFHLIVLTHSHSDHIETLGCLTEKFDLKVLIHNTERDVIDNIIPGNRIICFKDSYDLNEFGITGKVIWTPGHSEGSSAVVLDNEIALIGDHIGDFYTKPWAKKPKQVNDDCFKSMKRLVDINCKEYIASHNKKSYSHGDMAMILKEYQNGKPIYK